MNWMKLSLLAVWLSIPLAHGAVEAPLDPVSEETVEVSVSYASPLRFGLDFKYAPIQYPRLSAAEGHAGQISFEYIPLGDYKNYIGKPALGVSAGTARIANIGTSGNFNTFTLSPYFVYRLDFLDNQILVPFGKVGRSVTLERRSPSGRTRYFGLDYSVGVEFCLNALDKKSARQLDDSTGINNTFLIVEWMKSTALTGYVQDDLSREEWQIGLRFEM